MGMGCLYYMYDIKGYIFGNKYDICNVKLFIFFFCDCMIRFVYVGVYRY